MSPEPITAFWWWFLMLAAAWLLLFDDDSTGGYARVHETPEDDPREDRKH